MQQDSGRPLRATPQPCGQNGEGKSSLSKALKWPGLLAIQIGATIGAGIFVLIGMAIVGDADGTQMGAGPSTIFSVLLAGILCTPIAFCYGHLASRIPKAGGSYNYTRKAFGEFPGWMIGWTAYTPIGMAVIALGCVKYGLYGLELVYPDKDIPANQNEIAAVIVGICTFIAALPINANKVISVSLALVRLGVILFFCVLAFPHFDEANWQSTGKTVYVGVLPMAAFLIYAFAGFEMPTNMAEESENPQNDMLKTILLGLAICTISYFILVAALTRAVPTSNIARYATISLALGNMGYGVWMQTGFNVAIFAILASVLISFLLQQSRILWRMSADNCIPVVSKIHARSNTPSAATFITGMIVAFVTYHTNPKEDALRQSADVFTLALLVTYCVVCIVTWRLRSDHSQLDKTWSTWFIGSVSAIGVVICMVLVWALHPCRDVLRTFGWWTALGCIVYVALLCRKRIRIFRSS